MARTSGSGRTIQTYQLQADAVISQANPVSATLYEVLPATKNVRIIGISVNVTWAVTQPDPLEVVLTIDGNTVTHQFTNPVSATNYGLVRRGSATEAAQPLASANNDIATSFNYEGGNIRVQTRITLAVTQPTPLVCRVKWAKIV